ncbi:hypothetical protein GCM10025859_13810 [Alicyclobacillus fastidiosus]|nr:hypothetical protein GCM10025859_13810 [Alicyclobacillus fastidiosus]
MDVDSRARRHGGAQPLAITMNGGVALVAEVDDTRINRRLQTRYLDRQTASMDEAMAWVREAVANKQALSIGIHANAIDVFEWLLEAGMIPDFVTDQTSAHDPLNGYLPQGMTPARCRPSPK